MPKELTNMPTVSVAVCAYNGESYIEAQLTSIASQSIKPTEIIICDDGSTDGTIALLEAFSRSVSFPVRIERNITNLGVTRNFEKAISLCSGDVVFLADQDDVWFPEKIKTMIEPFIGNGNVGLVYCDALLTDSALIPTGKTVFNTRGSSAINDAQNRSALELLYRPNIKGCTMACAGMLVHRILPIPLYGDKPIWSHDYWIACLLAMHSEVKAIPSPLMYYRIHQNNTSGLVEESLETNRTKSLVPRHASHKVVWRYALYSKILTTIGSLTSSKNLVNGSRFTEYCEVLNSELGVLGSRLSIWAEKDILKRTMMVFDYITKGNYARFKHPLRQILKDLVGYYTDIQ